MRDKSRTELNGTLLQADATVASIQKLLGAARAKEEALLLKTFGNDAARAGEGQAVKASAMWNLISTPAENGGAPLLPVSRVWNFAPNPINDDFTVRLPPSPPAPRPPSRIHRHYA